ncbi:hypothetical protein B0H14DRAFT_2809217 [Mycena olivaceomarginata]|nr:hypothetical protein B0H14DRAFT_2809217 [Mycena olivaceomarginata]
MSTRRSPRTYVGLTAHNMAYTFPPASAARTKALFAQRVGAPAWDDLIGAFADAEKRAGIFRAFDAGIAGLARLYAHKEGPFLEGQTPSYADLVVGGCLRNFSRFLEQEGPNSAPGTAACLGDCMRSSGGSTGRCGEYIIYIFCDWDTTGRSCRSLIIYW